MGWLIDTSIWIAVERAALGAADVHSITRLEPVFLSPVNIAEIRLGLELMPPGSHKQKAAAMLRRLIRKPQLRITLETAETFGRLAVHLKRSRRDVRVRINDLWLASQAVQRNFKLLTSNEKDFADIPELQVVLLKLSSPS